MQLASGTYLGRNANSFTADGLIVSETYYHTDVFDGWHYHENTHLTFLLKGGNWEERKKGTFQNAAGQVMVYTSNDLHRNYATLHPSKNINLEIEPVFYKLYDLDENAFQSRLRKEDLRVTMIRIFSECKSSNASAVAIHSLLLEVLQPAVEQSSSIPPWAIRLKEILHEEWNTPHTLKDLALQLGVHPVTVSNAFKNYYHCNASDYIRRIRVNKAIEKIASSEVTLTKVAYDCGFYDQSHFIRYFKKFTGMTPRQLKNMQH
jgi:AraC family transcriptional regulator